MGRRIHHVDVFTTMPLRGNPVAVVLDGDGLTMEQMQRLAAWVNLSETTFVLPPTLPEADYRVRIFTPVRELPFAGHPTLGTCHAWLATDGAPGRSAGAEADGDAGKGKGAGNGDAAEPEVVVQQCEVGLIPIRRTEDGLAFASPPLVRSGPVDEELIEDLASVLGIHRAGILDAEWVDNGPGWVAVFVGSVDAVLGLRPGVVEQGIGVVGLYPPESPQAIEVRAFFPQDGYTVEDPVTGSLNAALAPWLLRTGRVTTPYVASQGTVLGRAGRVHVSRDEDGTIWVGGGTVTCLTGDLDVDP